MKIVLNSIEAERFAAVLATRDAFEQAKRAAGAYLTDIALLPEKYDVETDRTPLLTVAEYLFRGERRCATSQG